MNKSILNTLITGGLLALAGPVFAASWTLGTSGFSDAGSGVTGSASAWSNTDGFSTSLTDSQIHNASTPAVSGKIESAQMTLYTGGIGIRNKDAGTSAGTDTNETISPEHSVDNNQRYDSLLLSFGQAVSLSSVTAGWASSDSDLSVLAFTGGDAAFSTSSNLQGLKYDQLLGNGWTLINHYANAFTLGSVTSTQQVSTPLYSSYWLIGAYNPTIGSNQGWTLKNDNIKLLAVAGGVCTAGNGQATSGGVCSPGVPPSSKVAEPGSLALAAVALLGLMRMRRRRSPA